MNEKKLRRKNLALRIMIFIGTYAGVNAVRGFFSIRMAVGNSDDYTILAMSSSLALDYLTFLLMSAAVFIMNFFVKQALSKKEWIIRAVVMGISVVLIWYSAPSISYIIYMGASRYSENLLIYPVDIKFAESYISSNLWTVFSYMVSAAVYVVLAVMSVHSIIKNNKKSN